jgi:hypothetical protein
VQIAYDRAGRSEETAKVTFSHVQNATKAIQKYNGVSLDGARIDCCYGLKSNDDAQAVDCKWNW